MLGGTTVTVHEALVRRRVTEVADDGLRALEWRRRAAPHTTRAVLIAAALDGQAAVIRVGATSAITQRILRAVFVSEALVVGTLISVGTAAAIVTLGALAVRATH